MNNNPYYDVIIIGARVAGSTLAAILGERGYKILLLDRSKFPSDALSTHFFRAPALRTFNEIGVYGEVQSSAPHLKVNYNVIDGIVFTEPVEQPVDYPFYLCVRRIILDEILIRRVKKISDIELKEGSLVKNIIWENDIAGGVKWESPGFESGTAKAKVIVGADGLNSFIAKEVKPKYEDREPVNRAMYYAYFSGLKANDGPAAEFHFNGNTLVYCFPCDSNLTLLAVSVPISQFNSFKRNKDNEFRNVLESMSLLKPRLDEAIQFGPIKGSGSVPGYMRIPYGKGWALVGDAAMVMDPWSGQGIDQATTHSLFLAQCLDEYFKGTKSWENAMSTYHMKRNEFSLKTYQRTSRFSVDLRPMTNAALSKRGLK